MSVGVTATLADGTPVPFFSTGTGTILGNFTTAIAQYDVRNLALGSLAITAVLPASQRELGLLDWVTLVFALLASIALYSGASQLLRNGAAIAAWRKARG